MVTASSTPEPAPETDGQRPRALSLRLVLPVTYLMLVVLSIGTLILWAGLQAQSARLSQTGADLELQARLIANGIEEPLVRWEEAEYESDHGEDEAEGERESEVDDEEDEDDETAPGEGPAGGRAAVPVALDPTLIRLVTAAAENTSGRVTLTDGSLHVLYSSDASVPVGTALKSPEFTTQTRDIRRDAWTRDQRLFVAVPLVRPGGALAGYVQLSIPMLLIHRQNVQTWGGLLLAGGGVATLTALVSLAMAHFIVRPVAILTRGAAAVAEGDLHQEVAPAGPEELRRLADAFNVMTTRLRDLLARQQDFVAHAAHELRTPLTALSLRLELVEAHGASDPDLAVHYLRQMGTIIQHLRRLSEQLLALAALDRRALPPRAPLDLAPLLYQLADDFGPQMQVAGHTLRVEVPPHLPPVAVNADQMQAAIRNLLDNAAKYTATGGMITLEATATAEAVEIAVADTGPGIPEAVQDRIFDRFFRGDRAHGSTVRGAGLGLALVKAVAEAYGGRVALESEEGVGSRFVVRLPRVGALTP